VPGIHGKLVRGSGEVIMDVATLETGQECPIQIVLLVQVPLALGAGFKEEHPYSPLIIVL
jgi:hypothetical protein